MTESLRSVIIDELGEHRVQCMAYCYGGSAPVHDMADAVLALPEMQAIRSILHLLAFTSMIESKKGDYILDMVKLPDSVREWVRELSPPADITVVYGGASS